MDQKIKCLECGKELISLISHIIRTHKMTTNEYRDKFNYRGNFFYWSNEEKEEMSVRNKLYSQNAENKKRNSDIQKNGASIFTIKYWIKKGYTESEAKNKVSEIQKVNSRKSMESGNLKERSHLCIEYWLKKDKTVEEAIEIIKNHQIKASAKSSKCKGKVRTIESKIKTSSSMKKKIELIGSGVWASHFGSFNGNSKIEREFFCYIKENINQNVEANVPVYNYIVDVIYNKKIIEFYGDFWHCNPNFYKCGDRVKYCDFDMTVEKVWEKDKRRIDFLMSIGYDVLIIWENDWKINKDNCIEKIKKYLL